jgi:hypothetical protein
MGFVKYYIFKICKGNDQSIKEVATKKQIDSKTISKEVEYFSKGEVIQLKNKGNSFFTIYKDDDGWNPGEEVQVVSRNGKKYLRTDSNEIEKDNLGELPEYEC